MWVVSCNLCILSCHYGPVMTSTEWACKVSMISTEWTHKHLYWSTTNKQLCRQLFSALLQQHCHVLISPWALWGREWYGQELHLQQSWGIYREATTYIGTRGAVLPESRERSLSQRNGHGVRHWVIRSCDVVLSHKTLDESDSLHHLPAPVTWLVLGWRVSRHSLGGPSRLRTRWGRA